MKEIISNFESVLVAFSGGVDSTFLLYTVQEVLDKENILAVTSASRIHHSFEIEEARELAQSMGVEHEIIETPELEKENFIKNDANRCYYCKQGLFKELTSLAEKRGLNQVMDGSNYDDQQNDYRPGRKAGQELEIISPLEEAQLTKKEIRKLSKEFDLPTWDKPGFSCLATRIPYNMKITPERLDQIEEAEKVLQSFDLNQIRVRHHDDNTVRIEINPRNFEIIIKNREEIIKKLKAIGYDYITLDIEGYRSGSMNEVLTE